MIKKLFIKGLFFEKDVEIEFTSPYKILVSENGYGKTTILNAFYALVSGDISKLRKFDYSSLGVEFTDGETVTLDRAEINFLDEYALSISKKILGKQLSDRDFQLIMDLAVDTDKNENEYITSYVSKKLDVSIPRLHRTLDLLNNSFDYDSNSAVNDKISRIKNKLGFDVVYLPTYRRVERKVDGISLTKHNGVEGGFKINFGMDDVKASIRHITNEIKASSVESFSKLNGQMLAQLVENPSVTNEMKLDVLNFSEIEIILERLADNISKSNKNTILGLIKSKEILNSHDSLVYMLSKLLEVYRQQSHNDTALRNFSEVCNNYLNGKKIYYDESTVTVRVLRDKSFNEVDLEDLSSGEKQILSIFSLLYLSKKDDMAIFFDEPELSLSIEWQKKLLPDIVASKKCTFLLATTHSPFIFANNLNKNTVDLSVYVKEL